MRLPSWRPGRPGPRLHAGRVVLHIGRNKAGSTTIQDYCLAQRDALLREGVRYVLFGHAANSVPGLDGFPYVPQLAEHALLHRGQTILVSNEFMSVWPAEYTQSTAHDLAGLDVRVLLYIRPYTAWVRSSYAFDVRCGRVRQDFDSYVEFLRPRISVWPALCTYGECFGWRNVRVRVLDARLMRGEGLLGDFREALGLRAEPVASPVANSAPHWAVLETLRALAPIDAEAGWPASLVAPIEALSTKLAACATAHADALPEPAYLTANEAAWLDQLYHEDLARIGAVVAMPASVSPAPAVRQGPCPSWALLPASFLRDAAQAASADPLTAPFSSVLSGLASDARRVA